MRTKLDKVTVGNGFVGFWGDVSRNGNILTTYEVVPLKTLSISMVTLNEDNGDYEHYAYDNGRKININGIVYMELQEMMLKKT